MISPTAIRRIILEQSKRAHVGHIGSCLSVADIIAALYGNVLNIPSPGDPDRDRFVLSKGHAALALYAAFYLKGWLDDATLNSFLTDGTLLGVHPEHDLIGVDFSTGSLGQGLSFGAGSALAARMQGSKRRTFVLLSDAECNEGAIWEAVMFAAHHQLGNLVAIVDENGQQALGYTAEVNKNEPLTTRWEAFGWDVHDVDGHDVEAMTSLLKSLPADDSTPHVLIARTTFGKGVSYMESQIKWHYMPMTDAEYEQALKDIETT